MKSKFLKKAIPLWLVIILMVDSAAAVGLIEYGLMKKEFSKKIEKVLLENDPEALVKNISQQVLPANGYTTSLSWEEIGKKLIEAGAIDRQKYEQIFNSKVDGQEELAIFDGQNRKIAINENNSRFVVNTLWALGLTNKSKVLDEGPMKTGTTPTKNFASTGGWNLGTKSAMELYSSREIIPLTDEQQELVRKIASNVYRPCCGNNAAFPDCNHGMAVLGYIEIAVAQNLSEKQIYKDLLAFNSFWFPTTYTEMAVYFKKEKNIDWAQVDAQMALSKDYSSALGAQKISRAVQNVPGLKSKGGSCGT